MRWAVLALLAVGCRIDLDNRPTAVARQLCQINTTSSLCTGADALTDCSGSNSGCFTYIKAKIFDANCKSDSCHNLGGTGKLDLSTDVKEVSQATAYANLMGSDGMGAFSMVDTSRRLVVPGVPDQSYLDFMLQKIAPEDMDPPASPPPANVQYMPQANGVLCCQKQDLVDRWIAGGALNN